MKRDDFKKIAQTQGISILDENEGTYVSKNCQINVYTLDDGELVGYKEDFNEKWGVEWYDEGAPLMWDIVLSNFDYDYIDLTEKSANIKKNGIWVIGDVHGEYDKLIKLIGMLPKDANICLTGDLVDRGKDSAKVVELVIQNDYLCVLGNHEQMMMKSGADGGNWEEFYGQATVSSYAEFGDGLFEAHVEYFKTLPYFLHFEIEGYKPLVVSHSYIHHEWINKEYIYCEYDGEDILWRHMHDKKLFNSDRELENGIFNIFGHSTVYSPTVTDTYCMIDTGAAFENNKYLGTLSAVHYPSLEVIGVGVE